MPIINKGDIMKKVILCFVLLIALCVNAFAACTFIQRDTSPRYELIYEVINTKFVPQNFSTDSRKEVENYQYQIPDSLLSELTTEELALYTMEYPAYIASLPNTIHSKDFTDFNGFTELTKREHWIEYLTILIEKNHSEGKDRSVTSLIKFLSSYYVYTRMDLSQQKCLLQSIKNTLADISTNPPTGENLSQIKLLFYYSGIMVQSYYPTITFGRISSISPFCFEYNYEEAKEKILTALLKAIESGEIVEAKK